MHATGLRGGETIGLRFWSKPPAQCTHDAQTVRILPQRPTCTDPQGAAWRIISTQHMADEPSDPRQAAPLGAERDVQCVELKPVALTAAAVSIDMQNPVPAPTTPDAAKKPAVGEPLWQPSDACVSDADIAAQMGQEKRFTIFYRCAKAAPQLCSPSLSLAPGMH